MARRQGEHAWARCYVGLLPSLVPFVRGVVVPKLFANELLITTSMLGPSGECSIEIDIDYHATEVE